MYKFKVFVVTWAIREHVFLYNETLPLLATMNAVQWKIDKINAHYKKHDHIFDSSY